MIPFLGSNIIIREETGHNQKITTWESSGRAYTCTTYMDASVLAAQTTHSALRLLSLIVHIGPSIQIQGLPKTILTIPKIEGLSPTQYLGTSDSHLDLQGTPINGLETLLTCLTCI